MITIFNLNDKKKPHETLSPRISMYGLSPEYSHKLPKTLPSVDWVRNDATQHNFKRTGGPGNIRILFANTATTEIAPEALSWKMSLPSLFHWSYFVQEDDVPGDLLEPVIFALSMHIRVLEETPEHMLRAVDHYLPHQKAEVVKPFMMSNVKAKLANHLLHPLVDRPSEALPLVRALVHDNEELCKQTGQNPWLATPNLYDTFGHVLTLSGIFTKETKAVLELVIGALDVLKVNPMQENLKLGTGGAVRARIHLAQVLHQLESDIQAERRHVEWAATFLRKNPMRLWEDDLRQILARKDQPMHPVLKALGGMKWFDERKSTQRTDDRLQKHCRNCRVPDHQKKLFRCSRCQWIYYCSRECQRADWKWHKDTCRDAAANLEKVEKFKLMDPVRAQKEQDWIDWRQSVNIADTSAVIHALGLHRDLSRWRTHIFFRQVSYTPNSSKGIWGKFRTVRCGVYRIVDVQKDIEDLMGLEKGEALKQVEELIVEQVGTNKGTHASFLQLKFCEGVQTWLTCGGVSLEFVHRTPYDPAWRKLMDPKQPPVRIGRTAIEGAEDAEHLF